MKKKEKTRHHEKVRGVQLYRDDIEHILMSLENQNFETRISDADYTYDSLEELLDNRGYKPREFSINAFEKKDSVPIIQIDIEKDGIWLWSHGPKDDKQFLWYEIRDFLSKQSKWFRKIPVWILFVISLVLVNVDVQLLADKEIGAKIPVWFHYTVIVSVALWLLFLLYNLQFSPIVLRKKHEGSFLKRNSERIFLLVIGAILGAISTLIVNLLTRK